MNTTNKTVLITGGGSGIGFAIAKLLANKGNKVLITGRNEDKLKNAASKVDGLHYFTCDINSKNDVDQLVQYIVKTFGGLDILINNAGQAFLNQLGDTADSAEKAGAEMTTNYLSVISLTDKLLPLLKQSNEAAIVNVSSILAFLPAHAIPTYSASKAALHSYTQALRYSLTKSTGVKVFELMPPLVNTELSAGIGGANGIPPEAVAEELINGFEADHYEIHVGDTAQFYQLFHSSPAEAFSMLNN
jgi:uncharacterized oxidoreductase